MTRRPSRLRRWLRWVGLVGCALVIALAVSAQFGGFGYRGKTWCCATYGAGVVVGWGGPWRKWFPNEGWSCYSGRWMAFNRPVLPGIWIVHSVSPRHRALTLPYAALFVLFAAPTLFLCFRDRRPPPECCQRCGYDLTGNVSGKCPECGTAR